MDLRVARGVRQLYSHYGMADKERRRSAIPQPGTSLRAPSPSNAAFSSSVKRGSVVGPLGTYRPASRDGTDLAASQTVEVAAGSAPIPSRFGFGNASSSSSSILAPKLSSVKRTHSSAGLPETPGPNGSAMKRPLLTSASATTTSSSRLPPPSPSYDASKLKSEYERRELLSKQAYEKLQGEWKASGREIDKMKQERLSLLRQWEEANAERKEEKESFEEQRKFLNDRVNTLQEQNQSLKLSVEAAQAERAQLAQSAHEEETKQSLRINALEFELASAKAQAEESKDARGKMELALNLREKEWEEERGRSHSATHVNEDSKILTTELSSLMAKIHRLESETITLQQENRHLKTRTESIEALKEQKRDLEDRVGLVDEIRRKFAEAEARILDLTEEKEQWTHKLGGQGDMLAFEKMQDACSNVDVEIPSISAPEMVTVGNLPTYLSSLQGAVSGLTVRSRALDERVHILKRENAAAQDSIRKGAEKLQATEEELSTEKMERLKATKKSESAKMEVESYVKLLDTFQEESRNQSAQYNAASAEHIQVLEGRLKTMDGELQESKEEAERLKKLTQGGGGMSKEEKESVERESEAREKDLLRSLEESREEYAALEKQCVELGKMNDDLFIRVGRGEFDQTKLRCLEMKHNPISQDQAIRTSTLDALRKENKELLAQVEELSKRVAAQAQPGDESMQNAMVPVQTLENQKREYEELKELMRSRDKAFDRLKQAFAAKATEYVAAVKALFGYDMHVVSKGKVKLRSIYARTAKGTSLTFDSSGEDGASGNMKLVGEARQGIAVGTLQEYWLGNDRFSVPCFLAALQLELYEGTTRAVRETWEADEAEN